MQLDTATFVDKSSIFQIQMPELGITLMMSLWHHQVDFVKRLRTSLLSWWSHSCFYNRPLSSLCKTGECPFHESTALSVYDNQLIDDVTDLNDLPLHSFDIDHFLNNVSLSPSSSLCIYFFLPACVSSPRWRTSGSGAREDPTEHWALNKWTKLPLDQMTRLSQPIISV